MNENEAMLAAYGCYVDWYLKRNDDPAYIPELEDFANDT